MRIRTPDSMGVEKGGGGGLAHNIMQFAFEMATYSVKYFQQLQTVSAIPHLENIFPEIKSPISWNNRNCLCHCCIQYHNVKMLHIPRLP